MTKFTKTVVDKFKLPVMALKVSVAGEDKTFTSPVAETILDQIRQITVGEGQVHFFDTADKKYKSFTYCCGDKYEFSYTAKEYTINDTERDCYGFPVAYDEAQKGSLEVYKELVKVKDTYAQHLQKTREAQFGKPNAVAGVVSPATSPSPGG